MLQSDEGHMLRKAGSHGCLGEAAPGQTSSLMCRLARSGIADTSACTMNSVVE